MEASSYNLNISNKESGDILKRLKEWRSEICQRSNVPAYIVMHDRTLLEIIQKKPASIDELQDIHGFGPTKIMKYGKEVLQIVNN